MHNFDEIKNSDCPVCGKEEGAYSIDSQWGHNISCCSDKCGFKIKEIIEKNISSKKFKEKLKKYRKAERELHKVFNKGLPEDVGSYYDFELFIRNMW